MPEPVTNKSAATGADGKFDTESREYVIRRPDTPLPWINYLGNNGFRSIVSNTGGGYSFYRDAKLRRITRYRYDSVPLDSVGKYLYITDNDTTWNPGWRPTRTALDRYECRHGLGYTTFHSAKNGLSADLDVFVADDLAAEIQCLTLTNQSLKEKSVRIVSYVEWCQWNAEDDSANLQRNLSIGEVFMEDGLLCHVTGYRERRRHYAFHTHNQSLDGFDSDRDHFLGPYGELSAPRSVVNGRSNDTIASGWWPIASLAHRLTLRPGESRSIVFATGFAENAANEKWREMGKPNIAHARDVRERISDPDFVRLAKVELANRWSSVLSAMQIDSPESQFDDLVNTWNPYQCMVTFELARSASLFETGRGRGIGFRDSNQDCLGVVHLIPERVRERLIDLAATQFSDGSAYHQYQPLTKSGNDAVGSGFNDDPLWLVLSVAAYIRETGEVGFLGTRITFEDTKDSGATMLDHLRASVSFIQNNLGEHGLPLIGRADWNDCLNLNALSSDPDESFQTGPLRGNGRAESTMIAALYILATRELAGLCTAYDLSDEAQTYLEHADSMVQAVERHGWDGAWFLRAYDNNGKAVGSHRNTEGQIFVEPQGLCAMAEIGLQQGLVERALDSAADRLATPFGLCLLDPPYQAYDEALGEISTYLPGYKENGSVFCHNNPWVVIGETVAGNGDRAMEYLRCIAPTYQDDHARRRVEPYVFAQTIAGKAAQRPGEGKNSWLTGTASWAYVATTQHLLGIRPEIGGLRIRPCIPRDWAYFEVIRRFRGAFYRIKVLNPRASGTSVARIVVDGRILDGDLIPAAAAGSDVKVTVELG